MANSVNFPLSYVEQVGPRLQEEASQLPKDYSTMVKTHCVFLSKEQLFSQGKFNTDILTEQSVVFSDGRQIVLMPADISGEKAHAICAELFPDCIRHMGYFHLHSYKNDRVYRNCRHRTYHSPCYSRYLRPREASLRSERIVGGMINMLQRSSESEEYRRHPYWTCIHEILPDEPERTGKPEKALSLEDPGLSSGTWRCFS